NQYFKDDATAFNALKLGMSGGKGEVNDQMSATMFRLLEKARVPTYFLSQLSECEVLCRQLDIINIQTLELNIVVVICKSRVGLRGTLHLGDEISPDTCRLWDAKTRQKLDKDRFRQDLGGVEEAYHEVYRRVVQGMKPDGAKPEAAKSA